MADNPSAGGGKIRSKRAALQRKPYSRAPKKSFFTKVSDSVKSILTPITPRWLVNFRGNEEPQSSTQSDVKVETAEEATLLPASDLLNHTNNNLKHSQLSRRPLKNFQTSPASSSQYSNAYEAQLLGETQTMETVSRAGTGKESLVKHLDMVSKRAKIDIDTPLTSDSSFLRKEMKMLSTADNASVASSSDCSSLQINSCRGDGSDKESIGMRAPTSRDTSLSNPSSTSQQQSTMRSSKRPRFNPAVFGMQPLGLSSPEPHQSSFYEGSVQYGGANALGRSPYFVSPYKIPSVTKVKVRHMNHQRSQAKSSYIPTRNASLPLDESMSSTARKILQTLEKMSSPLNDARKIPTISRTPSSYAASRSRRHGRESSVLQNSTLAPPITGLSSPSVAKLRRRTQVPSSNSLLKRKESVVPSSKADISNQKTIINHERTKNSVNFETPVPTVVAARGLPAPIASLSSSAEMVRPSKSPFSTPNSSGGGKMKSGKKSSAHYTSMPQEDDEVEQPELPNVTLAVSSLPSFNFGSKEMTSTPAALPPVTNSKRKQNANDPKFNFASPIVRTSQHEQPSSASDIPKFQFSLPPPKCADIQESHAVSPPKAFTTGPTHAVTPGPKVLSGLKTASKRTISPLATSDASQRKINTPESLKRGSVMDILGGKPIKEKDELSRSRQLRSKPNASGRVCEVQINESDNAGAAKPDSSPKTMLSNPLPIQQNKGWDCEVCMVPNDAQSDKCVACGTSKPGSSSQITAAFKPAELSKNKPTFSFAKPDSSSKTMLSNPLPIQQNKGWDCEVCMVPNDAQSDKCVACGISKPGSSSQITAALKPAELSKNKPTFSFGITSKSKSTISSSESTEKVPGFGGLKTAVSDVRSTATYKFGVPSVKSAKTSSQPLPKKSHWGDLVAKTSGQWECEVCMVPNSNDVKSCEACNSPKPGTKSVSNTSFKFGENSSGLFQFSAPTPKEADVTKNQTSEIATQTSQSVVTSKPSETAKPSFSIGVPPSASALSKIPQFSSQPTNKVEAKPTFAFGQKIEGSQSDSAKSPAFDVPVKKGTAVAPSKPVETPTLQQSKGLSIFGIGASSVPVTSAQAQPSITNLPISASSNSFGNAALAKSAPVPAFGTTVGGASSDLKLKPFPTAFTQGTESKQAASPSFSFGRKPTVSQSQDATASNQTKPAFSFGAKSASPVVFGGGASQSESSGNVTSTTSGFGSSIGPEPAKKSSPFMNAGAQLSGFGQSSGTGQAITNESSKPVFGGFGTTTPAVPSQSTGGNSGLFGSTAKPAVTTQFGGASSTQLPPPAFGSLSGSSSTAFGAVGSTKSTFGNPASNSVFGGTSGTGQSIFGQPTSTGTNSPKPTLTFGASGTSGNATSGFGQSSSAGTSSLPKPNLPFGGGASNASSTTGGFSFGASSNTQQSSTFQFGAANKPPAASQTNTGFSFGSTSTSQKSSGSGGFSFGGNSSGQSGGVFQFGGSQQSNDTKGLFQGGSQSGGTTSTGFNFGASSASTPSFNFTGGNQPGTAPAFGSGPSQNMFDAKSATPGQQRRVIKTARRKLRK